jgi:muconolactone delta-isomerase
MEFLVTMTTRVPDGVSEAEVDEVREREASRSRELSAEGQLVRLWRPPLRPGEWRTFGLFQAADADELETVLASMPLRIWRTDDVKVLGPHPNDPSTPTPVRPEAREYFTIFTLTIPADAESQVVEETVAAEDTSAARLAEQGKLERLWRLPDGSALGLWQTTDDIELEAILTALPLAPWLQIDTLPLTTHPSDPAHLTA